MKTPLVSIDNVTGVKREQGVVHYHVNGTETWEEQKHILEVEKIEEFLEEVLLFYVQLKEGNVTHTVIDEIRYGDDGYCFRARGLKSYSPVRDEHKISLFYFLSQFDVGIE